ncbi:MAG: carboxypeptidase-like regulatory domain-containing protein [Terracidiphilus sp.]|nr:carboxypeptidase-like regulatory domain-containing protein [Terracidiphilus sp.]
MINCLARCLTQTLRWQGQSALAIVLAISFAICGQNAIAQSGAGSIQGTVSDPSGAVLPGATIHVLNQATNVANDTTANSVGFYRVPSLFAGTYTVSISAPGMKTYVRELELLVNQTAIIDATMVTGAVSQQVEVTADLIELTTSDSGTIGSTLDSERISAMPQNGRNLFNLLGNTTPGLEFGGLRANGLMGEAMTYVADGVSLDNRQFGGLGGATNVQAPDPDSVQEVRAETTNTSAKYASPGTITITTKSGTNAFHGTMFETARNNSIGAAKPRTLNYVLPHLVRNEFGLSGGGPIIIPRLYNGRSKSFWFFAFQRYSLAQNSPENVAVPTVAERGGDWSALTTVQLYDPNTTYSATNCAATAAKSPVNAYCRTPFGNGVLGSAANNQIPIGRISPTSKIIYDITQLPGTNATNPSASNPNLSTPNLTYQVIPTYTFRLDHVFNQSNRAYLRFQDNISQQHALRNYPSNSPYTIAADGFPAQASGMAYNPVSTFATALGYTHVFSPTFYSETILSRQWFGQHNLAGGNPNLNYEQMLGLPNNFGETGFPSIGANLICPYGGTMFQYGMTQFVSNIDENMTKLIGHHTLQFGGRYRLEQFSSATDQSADTIAFSSSLTGVLDPSTGTTSGALSNTGFPDGDMFLGGASTYSVVKQAPHAFFHDMEFDAYIQDDYRIKNNLTLNLGVRWEAHPAMWMGDGLMQSFDLKNDALALSSTPAQLIAKGYTTQAIITNLINDGVNIETFAQAGLPSKGAYDYNRAISPRVGFAWQPLKGRTGTVIRGAVGRYIYPVPVRNNYRMIASNLPYSASYTANYVTAGSTPDKLSNYLIRNKQIYQMGTNVSGVVDSTSTSALLPGTNLNPVEINPNQPPDFVTQVNLTVEQKMKWNSALRVTYAYTHASNLDQGWYFNRAAASYVYDMVNGVQSTGAALGYNAYDNKTWGGSSYIFNRSGWSNNNSLQMNYQRLASHGYGYQIAWTWSRAFRVGGNGTRDSLVYPATTYANSGLGIMSPVNSWSTVTAPALPPAVPSDLPAYGSWHGLNRFENYGFIDTAIPRHHIIFNGIVQLPVGRGKRFLGNANRFVDALVGDYQITGQGNITSSTIQVTNTNWGATSPIKLYKHKQKIMDCRNGSCYPAYQWFNGYIPQANLPQYGICSAKNTCVYGLPSDYTPYSSPIDPNYYNPGTTTVNSNYNTNNVNVKLTNGNTVKVAYAPGPQGANPYSRTFLQGAYNWTSDVSLLKSVRIAGKLRAQAKFDAFNVFNVQGYSTPNVTDGIQSLTASNNTPRQVQLTLRLTY